MEPLYHWNGMKSLWLSYAIHPPGCTGVHIQYGRAIQLEANKETQTGQWVGRQIQQNNSTWNRSSFASGRVIECCALIGIVSLLRVVMLLRICQACCAAANESLITLFIAAQ